MEGIDQDDVVGIVDATDTPEVAFGRKKPNAALRGYVNKLPPAQRELTDIFYHRETSIAEASEIVGILHATAKDVLCARTTCEKASERRSYADVELKLAS